MKEIIEKNKVLIVLTALIVVLGIVITVVMGFNFDLKYQQAKKVELHINKEFAISDIKQITNEVLSKNGVIVQKVEMFEDTASIIAKDITDEQKSNLITKINEKYGTEISAENTEIAIVPHTRGRDIVKPYIAPFLISVAIILCYMAIRYYKLNCIKVLLETIGVLVLAQILLFSVIAITRIPIGRLTIPLMILVYILSLLGITNKYEKDLATKKAEQEEKGKK